MNEPQHESYLLVLLLLLLFPQKGELLFLHSRTMSIPKCVANKNKRVKMTNDSYDGDQGSSLRHF